MEFADWAMSIQDQYDLIQDQQQNQPQNQQYYDATTSLTWVPTTMQAVYHAPPNVATTPATVATAPAGTTPTVYQPQPVLSTPPITPPTAPVVFQPQPLLSATATPTPAPPLPAPSTPAPPPSGVINSSPAAVKAKPPQAPDPTATATAPTLAKALTPTPPPYAPGTAPWRNTGTAQIAALRNEMREQLDEIQELRQQSEQEEAQLATEVASYNTESQAFTTELHDFHSEQTQRNTVLQELKQFQTAFRCDRVDQSVWNQSKNWNSWLRHYKSEQSHEIRAKYKNSAPKQNRQENNSTHYNCWHCGFKTYLPNQYGLEMQ